MKLIDLDFKNEVKDDSSFKTLQKLKLPNKSIEEFKRFDLSQLYETPFNFNYSSDVSIEPFEYLKKDEFYYIFISNSQFLPLHSNINTSIIFQEEQKTKTVSNNALYHLSESFFKERNQISITQNLDKPLLIINLFKNQNSFVPTSLNISIEKNCNADIVELFISQNSDECFLNINRLFDVKENATLNYTKIEEFSQYDTTIFNCNSKVEKDSNLNIISLDSHAKKSLNLWDFFLDCDNITLTINGIVNIKDNQHSANIANITHDAKNISSQVHIQHILDDKSQALFDVKTTINENAKFAKVTQSSKTTLVSDDARINAQPRLQIYTDELEANHSATTGAINQEELYYLKSRGIPSHKAITMIIESFENKIIDKITNETVKHFIKEFKGKDNV